MTAVFLNVMATLARRRTGCPRAAPRRCSSRDASTASSGEEDEGSRERHALHPLDASPVLYIHTGTRHLFKTVAMSKRRDPGKKSGYIRSHAESRLDSY